MTSASPPPSPSSHSLLNLPDGSLSQPYSSTSTIPPEGQIGNQTAELLREFVNTHSPTGTSIEDLPNLNMSDRGEVGIDKVALEAQRASTQHVPGGGVPLLHGERVLSSPS
jgi:hypothetical protein